MPILPGCQRGLRANVLACQRGLCANVPVCQRAKSVPISCLYVPKCQKTYQHAIRRANVSIWCANVPNRVPIFQRVPKGVPTSQTLLLRNAKGNFHTLLLYKKFYIILNIIVISYVYHSYIIVISYVYVSYVKIVLYFISILHVILKKNVWNFSFLLFFPYLLFRDDPGWFRIQDDLGWRVSQNWNVIGCRGVGVSKCSRRRIFFFS